MAVSGKTAAPIEAPYALSTDKPPDMAVLSKAMADRTHALLNGFALSNLAHGTAGQLIVVQSTGAAAYKALKGDATIAEDGTLTIANDAINAAKIATDAVGAAEIAAGAVGEPELADAAATSRKIKPSAGVAVSSAEFNPGKGGAFADVAGATLALTPSVASKLFVRMYIACFVSGASGLVRSCEATVNVDGATQTAAGYGGVLEGGAQGMIVMPYEIALSAAAHTIKVQAKQVGDNGVTIPLGKARMEWVLYAA